MSTATDRNYDKREEIDNCRLRVMYKVDSACDTLGKSLFDYQVLEVGDKLTYYYSNISFRLDSLWTAERKKVGAYQDLWPDIYSVTPREGAKCITEEVLIEDNKIRVTRRIKENDYVYTEEVPQINWQIEPVGDTILGYAVQKAVTTFRGRDYVAWFTMDIPYGYGPWKFRGLPGLILQIQDTKSRYVFSLVSIELPKDEKIMAYNIPAQKITREKMRVLMDMRWKDQETLYEWKGMEWEHVYMPQIEKE